MYNKRINIFSLPMISMGRSFVLYNKIVFSHEQFKVTEIHLKRVLNLHQTW
jgi:hypothetical protein